MIRNSLIPIISQKENRGSVEFQVLSFTTKIGRLTSAERGLRQILGKCQRLLAYLSKKKSTLSRITRINYSVGYSRDKKTKTC